MALIEANWKPNFRQLWQFAVLCAVALPLVAWLWGASGSVIAGVAVFGFAIAILGYFQPQFVLPLFISATLITIPIGIVVGELALLSIYLVVFVPISLTFRLIQRDRLQLKKRNAKQSYWQPKLKPRSVASYYRQS